MLIEVRELVKEFKVYERKQGFLSTLRNLIDYEYRLVRAVDGIGFNIGKGEMVGFIGPNGAGKSTTVKALCGILAPTSGEILIKGMSPGRHRKKVARDIGVVFGQKTQLLWDLPAIESLDLLKDIYDIPKARYKANLELMDELLGINEFIKRPVRQLSLGQRMKADICASLIHDPEIVYFDEPTIGLDVVAKENIREFVRKLNREKNTTVLFTTHDMDDIEKTCSRIIIIDHGKIIYDGSITGIKKYISNDKLVTIQFEDHVNESSIYGFEAVDGPENKKLIRTDDDPGTVRELINYAFANYKVRDILISEPDIEELIRSIYKGDIDLKGVEAKVAG